MNEANVFFEYWNDTGTISIVTDSSIPPFSITFDFHGPFRLGRPSDRPDFLFDLNGKIIVFEHFQFDSSKSNNKGSTLQKEMARMDKSFDLLPMKAKEQIQFRNVNSKRSLKDFERNLMKSLVEHSTKVEPYLQNTKHLVGDEKPLEMALFIQNKSLMEDVVYNGNKQELVTPFRLKTFIDFLCGHQDINHVFYGCEGNNGRKRLAYFFNSSQTISELRQQPYIDDSYDFFDAQIFEMRADIFISEK